MPDRQRRKGRIALAVFLAVLTCFMILFGRTTGEIKAGKKVKAVDKTADLRLIFTTDLHGQVNTVDYSSGKTFNKGSLAQAFTLIEKARSEVNKNNYMTFDIGDVLYSYSSDYIMGKDEDSLQPIYKAMKEIGYDAVTIGNHDLDFGYSYIKNQLKKSGLDKICVSSNVDDVLTKDSPWNNTMMLSKKVTASDGKKVTLKIGIIGEVVPVLSSKTEDYTGVLSSEDIVENARKEAANLKAAGADLVIVLSHSGMGEAVPETMAKNASYAVSQLEDVDVVLCGHEHNAFPSDEDASKAYYSLPGVDKKTGLANGKVIAMSKSAGQSIGVVDLGLKISGGEVSISKKSADIRMVDSKNTEANEKINNNFMGDWHDKLMKLVTDDTQVADFAEEASVNSYFGLLSDTDAIQIINNAKLWYGMKFVHDKLPDYEQYPMIAATKYASYGEIDGIDYMDIRGSLKESKMNELHPYNLYVAVYEISGKQLREWMEWSASAFQTTTEETEITDDTLMFYMSQYNLKSAVDEKWINDWRNFYVFDGVEYEMDASVLPRYSMDGNLINDTHRITKLTLNGKDVSDNQKFVLIGNHMSGISGPTKEILSQKLKATGYKRVQVIVRNYLNELSNYGKIGKLADKNWNVKLEDGRNYLLKSGIGANDEAIKNDYHLIGSDGEYNYYNMAYKAAEDHEGPNVVLSSMNTATTNKDVTIKVAANDKSGIVKLCYAIGKRELDDSIWSAMSGVMEENSFVVNNNSTYSVYAEDGCGNKSVSYITVSNINRTVLQAPVLKKFTNLMKYVKGTAEPGAEVYVKIGAETYSSKVDALGVFECPVPMQKAGEEIYVFVRDDSGRESEAVKATTVRKGPNQPEYEQLTNKEPKITGSLNDINVQVIAFVNGKVCVSDNGGLEAWKKCTKYSENKEVVETKLTIAATDFEMRIPVPYAGSKVSVYTVDAIGRVSRVASHEVLDVAPNEPVVYQVCNAESAIYGEIPECKEDRTYQVIVSKNGEEYTTDVDASGQFVCEFDEEITLEDDIRVYAQDKDEDGNERLSAITVPKVMDVESFIVTDGEPELTILPSNNKTEYIKGTYADGEETIYLKVGKRNYEVATDEDGNFKLDYGDKLKAGTVVYAVARLERDEIYESAKMTVTASVPLRPECDQEEISNGATKLRIYCDEDCTLTVRLNGNVYTAAADSFDEERERFLYIVEIDRTPSENQAVIYATNKVGNSKALRMYVAEVAPDAPMVYEITDKTKKIMGTVHILGNEEQQEEGLTVSNTETKVFARFGGENYEGKVKKDGTFTISIPKEKRPKEGTKVTVWASNNSGGTGPKKEITVVKATKK